MELKIVDFFRSFELKFKDVIIQRCHKTWIYTASSWDVTSVISMNNRHYREPHAVRYHLWRSLFKILSSQWKCFCSLSPSLSLCYYFFIFFANALRRNICHKCIVPMSFMVLQCADQFASKCRWWNSKILKYIHCNRNRKNSVVLNNHNILRIPANNNIWNVLSIGWNVTPLE